MHHAVALLKSFCAAHASLAAAAACCTAPNAPVPAVQLQGGCLAHWGTCYASNQPKPFPFLLNASKSSEAGEQVARGGQSQALVVCCSRSAQDNSNTCTDKYQSKKCFCSDQSVQLRGLSELPWQATMALCCHAPMCIPQQIYSSARYRCNVVEQLCWHRITAMTGVLEPH
jgi:hypothetical protein